MIYLTQATATERIDRREKLLVYQTLLSLNTYWLVDRGVFRRRIIAEYSHLMNYPDIGTVP